MGGFVYIQIRISFQTILSGAKKAPFGAFLLESEITQLGQLLLSLSHLTRWVFDKHSDYSHDCKSKTVVRVGYNIQRR
ncbi:hypothetical protein VSPL_31230 [Vibrio splendidus]|jgi:hypothetical protein|nr:hypothetical protein VSPL_31230 [Vibrio splendidus]